MPATHRQPLVSVTDKVNPEPNRTILHVCISRVIYIHVVLYSLVPGLSALTRKHKEACVCCHALVLIVLVAGTGPDSAGGRHWS